MARSALIEVEGLRALQLSLSRLGDKQLAKELRIANKKGAEEGKRGAEWHVPIRRGALKSSIGVRASARYAEVKAGSASRVPYAAPIHWGWPRRGIDPQPFMWTGVYDREEEIRSVYERIIGDLARTIGAQY